MEIDDERLYRAHASRDPRFDGRFFAAVRTTGIYCRPICPARTPARRNVEFHSSAASAQAAGYRPCKRCRPETAPGSSAWLGSVALVPQALALIDEGALDDGRTVAELAARLHVTERHLRRLFDEHVGSSPGRVAATRRLHLALRLLRDSSMPVTDIAYASGFGSMRRLQEACTDAYGQPPSALRGRQTGGAAAASAHTNADLRLRLAARPPFQWMDVLSWLAARATPGVAEVVGTTYRRTIELGASPGVLTVTPDNDGVTVTVSGGTTAAIGPVLHAVRRTFDLDADPLMIDEHLSDVPGLSSSWVSGTRVPGAFDRFELLVRAILGQQVSVAGATTMASRVATFGRRVDGASGTLTRLTPRPDELADAPLEEVGVTRQRAQTIRAVAADVAAGTLDLGVIDDLQPRLQAYRGIGPWTAAYVAMRCGDPDAFPATDLHLQRHLSTASDADPWRPWRAYAAIALWTNGKEFAA